MFHQLLHWRILVPRSAALFSKDMFPISKNFQKHKFNLASKTNKYGVIKHQQNIKVLKTVPKCNRSGKRNINHEEQRWTSFWLERYQGRQEELPVGRKLLKRKLPATSSSQGKQKQESRRVPETSSTIKLPLDGSLSVHKFLFLSRTVECIYNLTFCIIFNSTKFVNYNRNFSYRQPNYWTKNIKNLCPP